ncbi:hypothetical protein KIL84_013814 [Mauremys mutica]|uniref:Uncharacterized protein n=1 Tax=Mauremys mutica TaxID=74926 RepID=A0A9D3WS09_9SAUR|nr:hypothetical protein KIL84_013814 [Mauremys mutica]
MLLRTNCLGEYKCVLLMSMFPKVNPALSRFSPQDVLPPYRRRWVIPSQTDLQRSSLVCYNFQTMLNVGTHASAAFRGTVPCLTKNPFTCGCGIAIKIPGRPSESL